jgi:hypothetical protein
MTPRRRPKKTKRHANFFGKWLAGRRARDAEKKRELIHDADEMLARLHDRDRPSKLQVMHGWFLVGMNPRNRDLFITWAHSRGFSSREIAAALHASTR